MGTKKTKDVEITLLDQDPNPDPISRLVRMLAAVVRKWAREEGANKGREANGDQDPISY